MCEKGSSPDIIPDTFWDDLATKAERFDKHVIRTEPGRLLEGISPDDLKRMHGVGEMYGDSISRTEVVDLFNEFIEGELTEPDKALQLFSVFKYITTECLERMGSVQRMTFLNEFLAVTQAAQYYLARFHKVMPEKVPYLAINRGNIAYPYWDELGMHRFNYVALWIRHPHRTGFGSPASAEYMLDFMFDDRAFNR